MSQIHCSGTKSSALTIKAHSSKLGSLAVANLLQTNKKKQKWGLKVLGLEKMVVLAAERNHKWDKLFMFQVHFSGTKNTALTMMAQSCKLGPLAFATFLRRIEKKIKIEF